MFEAAGVLLLGLQTHSTRVRDDRKYLQPLVGVCRIY